MDNKFIKIKFKEGILTWSDENDQSNL